MLATSYFVENYQFLLGADYLSKVLETSFAIDPSKNLDIDSKITMVFRKNSQNLPQKLFFVETADL